MFLAMLATGCRAPAPVGSAPAPLPAAPAATPAPPPRVWTAGRAVVPVIMYHDVVRAPEVWFDLTTPEFERQMRALRQAGAEVVTLAALVAHLRDGGELPSRAVALTFDQGTLGLYTEAWPVLKRYGYPATFFVHTGYVGRPSPTKEHVTWAQLRELEATGLIDVQPMSVTFPEFLGQLPDDRLEAEIRDSQAAVAREMGHPARFFAYPYGNGDERVARALAAAGFEAAFNEVRAPCAAPSDRLFLPRYAPKRLNEVIGDLDRPRDGPRLVGPLDLTPPAELVTPGVTWWTGVWPKPAPERTGTVLLGPEALPCRHVLLAGGRFQPLADAREMAAWGRPLLVGHQRRVVLAPYRRWMSARGHVASACDSLNLLLSPANFAVLGERWLIRDGLSSPGEQAWSRPALVAIDAAGALRWGRCDGRTAEAELARRLAGFRQVVILGD